MQHNFSWYILYQNAQHSLTQTSSLIDGTSNVPSYNKPNFPNAVPQKACRPKFQPPPCVNKSEDSKDEGQDSGINVDPTSKEGLRKFSFSHITS